ncbi:MAG: metallophosphoesterase family protein [Lachnospiraceae bacterium]|nr:metallophosphoesterase family protein [Lachnospiraceae bacterium]
MRTIIVGDIHGCYHEFLSLLHKVNYNGKKDKLILLGDLMDRGPLSYEMLRLAMHWKKKNPDRFFLIRGNHEQMIVEQSGALDTRLIWRVVGKTDTIRSFRKHRDRMELYIPWILKNMPLYYKDEKIQCVHAGIKEENPKQNSTDLLVKDHSWSKTNQYGGRITIIGHTPLDAPTYYDGSGNAGEPLSYGVWKELPAQGAICIDTGCVFGKKLTAMILENGSYYLDCVPGQPYSVINTHFYVGLIRKFCALPLIRNFCSGENSK